MRAVLWGGPDDGFEFEVADNLTVIDHVLSPEGVLIAVYDGTTGEVDFGDQQVRRYLRAGIIRGGAAVFKIERCAP